MLNPSARFDMPPSRWVLLNIIKGGQADNMANELGSCHDKEIGLL